MHAYMIIAHNQFKLLEYLIKALDDERNDIFIHIDSKVKNFDFNYFENLTKYSNVYFTDRTSITWGDFSQVKCEMILLKAAVENQTEDRRYSYFHLISGVDLPIKSNDYIHDFFKENNGTEFIHYTNNTADDLAINRIKYYHFFRHKRIFIYKLLSFALFQLQRLIGVNRLKKNDISVQKGCNWFSITGNLAEYIVDKIPYYENIFKYSYCADEVFVQTIVENSEFKNNVYMRNSSDNHLACARLIDWKRGNPYVFRNEDFEEIISSPAIFARKFDYDNYPEIVEKILKHIKNE